MKARNRIALGTLAISGLLLPACGGGVWNGGAPNPTSAPNPSTVPTSTPPATLTVTSTAFSNGSPIPQQHACTAAGGANQSFQISWNTPLPVGTGKLAIVMDDETAPCGTGNNACVHWGVFNIPISVTQLAAGINPINVSPNIKLGKNYDGSSQYAGMCPPVASGIHTYTVSLFALSGTAPNELGGAGITRSQFRNSYGAYILGEGVLSGTYDRDNPTPTP